MTRRTFVCAWPYGGGGQLHQTFHATEAAAQRAAEALIRDGRAYAVVYETTLEDA